MKRIPIILILLFAVLMSCQSPSSVSGISVTSVPAATNGLLSVFLNQSVTLKATVKGVGAFNAAVQWSLSPNDGSLVSSGSTATFKPKAASTYTVTATSQADTNKRASVNITVKPSVASVSLTSVPPAVNDQVTVAIGQSATVSAVVEGNNTSQSVKWLIAPDDGALAVNANKVVWTPKSAGTYTLTATSTTDASKSATLTLKAIASDVIVTATPISIDLNQPSNLSANVKNLGGAVTWSADPATGTSFAPPGPGNTTVFSSSQPGTYTITAASVTNPNLKGFVTIEVKPWTASRLTGTNASDTVTSSATDANGNVYVAGFTAGALQASNQGQLDAFVAKFDVSGTPVWTQQLGSSKDDLAYGVAVDGSGNVYVAGTTSGTLPTASSAGNDDAFVAKFDSSGARQWISQFGSSNPGGGFENAFGVAVGPDGSVFVAGDTDGSFSGATNPDVGNTDAFVAKLDPSTGARNWTKQLGVIGNDTAYGVTVDGSGNVDIAGSTEGPLFGNSSGLKDGFLAQYSSAGIQSWVRQFGSSNSDEIKSIAVDASGNIFVAGQTDGNLSGSNFGLTDAFIAKYAANGTRTWVQQFGSGVDDAASGIAVDASGDAYISGQTDDDLFGVSAGKTDAFLTKFDASGVSQWNRQIGTSESDAGFAVSVADRGLSVVLAGYTEGSPFDGVAGAGGREGFIVKYRPDGSR
jgi:Beta-propeller repeat